MTIVETTETLHASAKTGATKYWRGHVLTDGTAWYTQAEYWQVSEAGLESVHQRSVPVLIEPKNVGRSNETTPEQQARAEMASTVTRQRDKGYRGLHETKSPGLVRPMLAEKYLQHGDKLQWESGVYGQPKTDGFRCVSDGERFWSRKGIRYPAEIEATLRFTAKDLVFDGELYLPEGTPGTEGFSKVARFQAAASAAKKLGPLTQQLRYGVFDLVDTTAPFALRSKALFTWFVTQQIMEGLLGPVEPVDTFQVVDESEIEPRFQEMLAAGYEGLMLRNGSSLYQVNQRTTDLLKLKPTDDEEYRIINIVDGRGKDANTAILVCVTPGGVEFRAKPMGTLDYRRRLFQERTAIGKLATVIHEGFTKDGSPRFPRAKQIREDWD